MRLPFLTVALAGVSLLAARVAGAESLNWKSETGFRWAELTLTQSNRFGFTRVSPETSGVRFSNQIAEARWITNRVYLSGSGVAAGDMDGDGRCDLYFCGLDGDNKLYRNLGGWKFEDVTAQAQVACSGLDCTGAAFADVDGNGNLDLLVNTLGAGTRFFRNRGNGVFEDRTSESGLQSHSAGMSLALADTDSDGDLDLYVAHYRSSTLMDRPTTRFTARMVAGKPVIVTVDGEPATLPQYTNRFIVAPSGAVLELGEPDVLYLNGGNGRFTALSFTDGAFSDEDGKSISDPPRDWSLTARFHDLTGDGAPDLYICSDFFTPDRIWINNGAGSFRAISRLALRRTSTFSMGIDFADLNRDGLVDFFVTDMFSREHLKRQVQVAENTPMFWPPGLIDNRPQINRNTLQISRGDGTFAEAGFFAGVEGTEWSWGPAFIDVDLDGYEDLIVPNGQWGDFQNADIARKVEELKATQRLTPRDLANLLKLFPRLETANLLFRNRGNLTFEETGATLGMNAAGVSQGMCLADLDNDGDLDVVMNNLNAAAALYRNECNSPRVAVRTKGAGANTQGIGAQIQLSGGAVATQTQEIIAGGRYLSGDDPIRMFAAGSLSNRMVLTVKWRNGMQTVIRDVRPNRLYEVSQMAGVKTSDGSRIDKPEPHDTASTTMPAPTAGVRAPIAKQEPPRALAQPLFKNVSYLLKHSHHEDLFDEFARQPLLPNRLSQLGPAICWADINGDSKEDLIIGSGRGGSTALLLGDGSVFRLVNQGVWSQTMQTDQTAVVSPGPGNVLIGSSNYEDGNNAHAQIKRFRWMSPAMDQVAVAQEWSPGPLALADTDKDGDLDLFVGGRVIPGRYPEASTSMLLTNDAGVFHPAQQFSALGLVSGAVFSDLDADGDPDLVLACEWSPIRVLRNEKGTFIDVTESLGLAGYSGWWNGVNTGDLDGDGDLDIVASNWGENCRYRTDPKYPRRIYFGDIDRNGTTDLIEAHYEDALQRWVPDRGLRAVAAAMPFLQDVVRSYEAYGNASLEDLYGNNLSKLGMRQATTLQSMVFFNHHGQFEGRALPTEAQWAPAFAVCIADLDGDGFEDVYLGQNFFAGNPDTDRCDAGRGLVLRGAPFAGLVPLSGQESGITVYGEQRGAALCDYDGDGRVDLAASQNASATQLFHNVGARPGLRIRLKGGAGNPNGVGAKLRLSSKDKLGPLREIHAGSGYWSQDSPVQVMSMLESPTQLWVQWPEGLTQTIQLPLDAREITVHPDGSIDRVR